MPMLAAYLQRVAHTRHEHLVRPTPTPTLTPAEAISWCKDAISRCEEAISGGEDGGAARLLAF